MDRRAVIHVDMDCFYAEVEHKRRGACTAGCCASGEFTGRTIPRSEPLAVRQWDGLIAVNYAARRAGVTRHMVSATKLQAPQLPLFADALFTFAACR